MLKQTFNLSTTRFAAAAALAGALAISVIVNTQNAEAASARITSIESNELVDIVEHRWRGPRHCHWRWRRGHWVYICHRH